VQDWKTKKQAAQESSSRDTEVLTVSELVGCLGRHAEALNLVEIESYLRTSKVIFVIYTVSALMLQPDCSKNHYLLGL
jgi:hypothetical protein